MQTASAVAGSDMRSNRRSAMMRVPTSQLLPMLGEKDIAVTRIRCDGWGHGLTSSYDLEDSFLLTVHLTNFTFGLTCRGQSVAVPASPAGAACIYEMDRTWIADMQEPFDAMHFHITRPALNNIAQLLDARDIGGIKCPPSEMVVDPVLMHLSQALLPVLSAPGEVPQLFVDHVRLALGAHVAAKFGSMRLSVSRGALAPWQMRRATEYIEANLDGNISVGDLADICGVSAGHLSRSFRQATGWAPHQWLTLRRVDRAKELLAGSPLMISEVALLCGFSDQSHLTRVFKRHVGATPAAWQMLHSG